MAIIEQRDAGVDEQWDTTAQTYTRWENGVQAVQRQFTDAEAAWLALAASDVLRATNSAALRAAGRQALVVNRAYLDAVAAGTATQAMVVAQVATLTRQIMGFGRLLMAGDLLDVVDKP